jgi:hypothetical protein
MDRRPASIEDVVQGVLKEAPNTSIEALVQRLLEARTPDEFLPIALDLWARKSK